MISPKLSLVAVAVLGFLAACSSDETNSPTSPTGSSSTSTPGTSDTSQPSATKTDEQYKAEVTTGMHDSIQDDLHTLVTAATALHDAAPSPTGRGWDATQDAAAIAAMKTAWQQAREAYEHIEGATAPIFPDVDASIDARYDDFLTDLGAAGDAYLFDDTGVTGLHAAERILWSDSTPANVKTFEASLQGYVEAKFPSTEAEAADFKNKLLAKVITDANTLLEQWTPAKIDIASAYAGLVGLMNEQKEKVNKASEGAEESRYSQQTMKDIRYNLEGTRKIYGVFQPWIQAKGGTDDDKNVIAGMDKLNTVYTAVSGDAIPQPPATWSAENPSQADLDTPFGKLYAGVKEAVDPESATSVVSQMNKEADLLGFPRFQEE